MSYVRGRPPTPLEIRRKLGNPQRRPMPPEGALATRGRSGAVPEPMRPLRIPGREMWERVLRAGASWINDRVDLELLLLLCEQLDERQQLRQDVLTNGLDRAHLRTLEKSIVTGLAALGFTPVDRARLAGLAPPQDSAASLDQMIAERESRSS